MNQPNTTKLANILKDQQQQSQLNILNLSHIKQSDNSMIHNNSKIGFALNNPNQSNHYYSNQQQHPPAISLSRNHQQSVFNKFTMQNNLLNSSVSNNQQNIPINIGRTMPTTQRQINLKTTTNRQTIQQIQHLQKHKQMLNNLGLNASFQQQDANNIIKQQKKNSSILREYSHTTGQQTTTAQSQNSKSFLFDLNSSRPNQQNIGSNNLPHNKIEHLQKNGCHAVYACGPLSRNRYINPKLEKELHEFKIEVEGKFAKSPIATFKYPRLSVDNEISQDQDNTPTQLNSNQGQQKLTDLSQYLAEAETEAGNSKFDPSVQISINYDQNNYDSQNQANSSIPALRNTHKYEQHLEQILRNTGMFATSSGQASHTNRNAQLLRKTDSTKNTQNAQGTTSSRFRDSSSNLRMPELKTNIPKSRYQDLNQSVAHSQDRYPKNRKRSNRLILSTNPQTQSSSNNQTMSNIINVNNPQVIIQSPQNNTIIVVDSKFKDSNSRNIINQLEKNGYITNKFDNINNVLNSSNINKSFNGDMSGINSFRNLQQSRIFDQFVKHQKLNQAAPSINKLYNQQTTRNKINISTNGLNSRIKYETNRSTVRNHQNQDYKNIMAKELDINNSQDYISKSFVFPAGTNIPRKN
eukprot:403371428